MPPDPTDVTHPAFLANYLASLPRPEHVHGDPARSVREDDFDGHHVVITTTYEITVDGQPLNVHIGVSNDGTAHCHGLPNYQIPSVVDLVRLIITAFPEEFSPGASGDDHGPHGDPGEHHHHDAHDAHDELPEGA
ncbi:hypothetical protein ThrDRAFT_00722 [Frankia casuarinae]|uniref:Uncharacterized protein n=1 Tax=Frankia casuarinae (strain DSM 45818 / CECT 9043 / HFP020203 / CcI3) TaxID=106370 RepID=Q2JGG5_FRACC|nr:MULTISPECIES: hypothetical protein [Frankia]ABD09627.1 hypothetical protein Francci3_0238 [Frankia casuarinae]EYT93660.1 hypothetical protein ThrDRAFT_00722 [Frankia casuarinae]KDA43882.1 hypothetical protein BMG523Draft_01264 [Frankia sp. BMG5.23]ORT47681.1 hypothetical protein KBI5_18380 [Frankia sp. KB5]